jgi:hypothetical protein
MPLQKISLKPGINREGTRYSTEGGYYDGDKIRFRQGLPEKIGGWLRISETTFEGVARSLHNWVTLGDQNLIGVGTHLKFYIENVGNYNDITPLRSTVTLSNPFTTTAGSAVVTVTDANGGYKNGDYVTFSNVSTVGGLDLNGEFNVSLTAVSAANTYTITADSAASSSATGGGTSVSAAYQINIGNAFATPITGWGAGTWGQGSWGFGVSSTTEVRFWSQSNFGEDLVFGHRGGGVYYWDASNGVETRGVLLSSRAGASDVPEVQNLILVSDISRFVFCFGTNEIGSSTLDPTLLRWSDQEDAANWTPSATNQAGSLRLSRGTEIVAASQARQEVLVFTDSSLYSLQYVGAPAVWTANVVGENISISSQNAVGYANGVAYWMGKDKFYKYDGRTSPLKCDVRRYVFNDFNTEQYSQVFSGTNESFHEVWWFYCSSSATNIDKYVIYNYLEDIWYYGTLARTAWLDSGLRDNPLAATYDNNLVDHESGIDDNQGSSAAAITAYVESSEFDLDDGHKFMHVNRVIPDVSFDGSTATSPVVTMTLKPLRNSGSGIHSTPSLGGVNNATVTRTASSPVEVFTDQINVRVRGRQLSMRIESSAEGVTWQLGAPRIDMRPDGRR